MTEHKDQTWSNIDLSGDPHLVLGKRRGRGITAVRVNLHANLHGPMRTVCQKAIYDTQTTRPRAFDSNAALEGGEEHFRLTVDDVHRLNEGIDPGAQGQERQSATLVESGAPPDREDFALVGCLRDPAAHPLVKSSEFKEFQPFFYAVCFQLKDGSWISFLRKTNPQQFFRLGRLWCQYGNALKQTDQQPTFALDPAIDVIMCGDNLAGFSENAMKFLFTDAKLARSAVPDQVELLRQAIEGELPLSNKSISSLISAGARRNTIATRIYGLRARLDEVQELGPLDVSRFRKIAGGDEDVLGLINEGDELDFDEEHAETFLDFIEGRYFADDWTGTDRRADRWSKRR